MGFGGSGGSTSSIAGASDTTLNNPTNDQVLAYDGTTSMWKNAEGMQGPQGPQGETGPAGTALIVAEGSPLPAVVNGAVLHVYDPTKVLS